MNLGLGLGAFALRHRQELLDFHDLPGDVGGDGVVYDGHSLPEAQRREDPVLPLGHADAGADQRDLEVGHR